MENKTKEFLRKLDYIMEDMDMLSKEMIITFDIVINVPKIWIKEISKEFGERFKNNIKDIETNPTELIYTLTSNNTIRLESSVSNFVIQE